MSVVRAQTLVRVKAIAPYASMTPASILVRSNRLHKSKSSLRTTSLTHTHALSLKMLLARHEGLFVQIRPRMRCATGLQHVRVVRRAERGRVRSVLHRVQGEASAVRVRRQVVRLLGRWRQRRLLRQAARDSRTKHSHHCCRQLVAVIVIVVACYSVGYRRCCRC